MIRIFILIGFFLTTTILNAQLVDIKGHWKGEIKISENTLPLIFHLERISGKLSGTIDSPAQGAEGIPISTIDVDSVNVIFTVLSIGAKYHGEIINEDSISGKWKQGLKEFELNLSRVKNYVKSEKPQTPKPPFPYLQREVKFTNREDGAILSGTLTYPKIGKHFPAVVLITGSGLQDRDEKIFNHKPFFVLSDFLTRNGIAVLRYDDRGFGKSTGDAYNATTLNFAMDARAAIEFLQSQEFVNHNKIGIIGHSEGGEIAAMIAAAGDVNFAIMLAGPTIAGDSLLLEQNEKILLLSGVPASILAKYKQILKEIYKIAKSELSVQEADKIMQLKMNEFLRKLNENERKQFPIKEKTISMISKQLLTPWFRYFMKYNPESDLSDVDVPLLALFASKDSQVLAKSNSAKLRQIINEKEKKNIEIKVFEGLNHLFQHCKTGNIDEYKDIEETISPEVLKYVLNWIKNR